MKSPFLNRIRRAIRERHYSIHTEKTYIYWVVYFIKFHGKKHPDDLNEQHIRQFLSFLAVEQNVAASTQKTALNALVFVFKHVLKRELEDFSDFRKAKGPKKLPVVLSRTEIQQLLKQLNGSHFLCAGLMYGSGLRVMETVRLRVHDIDIDKLTVFIRDGKGRKSRMTTLAPELVDILKLHIEAVGCAYKQDQQNKDWAGVFMPHALDRKYPNAPFELGWQFLFPSANRAVDPRDGNIKRHHRHQRYIQKPLE